MAWTTADLLTAVKNRQMIPDASTGSLSSAALLQYATEELYITLVPIMLGIREKYYETYLDTPYTTATTSIPIPSRSIGSTLSCVQFINGFFVRNLEPIDTSAIATTETAIDPSHFYFQNNSIIPYPPPTSSHGTLRMRYFQRPSRLEQTVNCAQITIFDPVGMVATCVPPPSWTTSSIVDFIPQTASQCTPYNLNTAVSNTSSTTLTLTLTAAQAALVSVGDWIALSEYSPIPEIPFELQPVLTQATCCRALVALNDQTALVSGKAELAEYVDKAVKILTPRDQQGNKKVVSNWRRF